MKYKTSYILTGNQKLSNKYLAFARSKLDNFININNNSFVKNIDVRDNQDIVNIKLQYNKISETAVINISSTGNSVFSSYNGLTIKELNYPSFTVNTVPVPNQFVFLATIVDPLFKNNSELFQTSLPLQLSSYQNSFVGNQIGQQRYIYGNQYSGELRQIVQILLGSNIKVEYQANENVCHGIYSDSIGGKHLIKITPSGVFSNPINYVPLTTRELTTSVPDGQDFTVGNLLINSTTMSNFYSNTNNAIVRNLWIFNSNGSQASNISFNHISIDGNIRQTKSKLFKINITDIGGVLSATLDTTETEKTFVLEYDKILREYPLNISGVEDYYPSILSRDKYINAKNIKHNINLPVNPFDNRYFTNALEYKAPIFTYYTGTTLNTLNYYFKATKKDELIINDNGLETLDDFFNSMIIDNNVVYGWVKEFDILEINNKDTVVLSNDGIPINYEVLHGFVENDATDYNLGNSGDYNLYYDSFTNYINNYPYDDFSWQVGSATTSPLLDLQPFTTTNIISTTENFLSSLDNYNNKISEVNQTINQLSFYGVNDVELPLNKIVGNINKDIELINEELTLLNVENLPLLDDVIYFNEYEFLERPIVNYFKYLPYLYEYDNTVASKLDYIVDNSSSISTFIGDYTNEINLLIPDIESIDLNPYLELTTLLKSYTSLVDLGAIKTKILDINADLVSIQDTIDNVNDSIEVINLLINGPSSEYKLYLNNVLSINNSIGLYNNDYKDILVENKGITILQSYDKFITNLSISNPDFPGSGEPEFLDYVEYDRYIVMQGVRSFNFHIEEKISNIDISRQSLLLNPLANTSYSIINEDYSIEDINYDSFLSLKNTNFSSNFCKTNELMVYKQKVYYYSGVARFFGDIIPDGSLEYNSVTIPDVGLITTGDPNYATAPSSLMVSIDRDSLVSNNIFITSLGITIESLTNQTVSSVIYNASNGIFESESYDPSYDKVSIREVYDKKLLNDIDISLTSNMITKDRGNTITTNSGTYLGDKRFTDIREKFIGNIQNNKVYLNTKDDGIFFSYISDAFSNNYVISDGVKNYDNKTILTNITRYSSIKYDGINSHLVNYVGVPFF